MYKINVLIIFKFLFRSFVSTIFRIDKNSKYSGSNPSSKRAVPTQSKLDRWKERKNIRDSATVLFGAGRARRSVRSASTQPTATLKLLNI